MHVSCGTSFLTSTEVETRASPSPVPVPSQEESVMAVDTHPMGEPYLLPLLF